MVAYRASNNSKMNLKPLEPIESGEERAELIANAIAQRVASKTNYKEVVALPVNLGFPISSSTTQYDIVARTPYDEPEERTLATCLFSSTGEDQRVEVYDMEDDETQRVIRKIVPRGLIRTWEDMEPTPYEPEYTPEEVIPDPLTDQSI